MPDRVRDTSPRPHTPQNESRGGETDFYLKNFLEPCDPNSLRKYDSFADFNFPCQASSSITKTPSQLVGEDGRDNQSWSSDSSNNARVKRSAKAISSPSLNKTSQPRVIPHDKIQKTSSNNISITRTADKFNGSSSSIRIQKTFSKKLDTYYSQQILNLQIKTSFGSPKAPVKEVHSELSTNSDHPSLSDHEAVRDKSSSHQKPAKKKKQALSRSPSPEPKQPAKLGNREELPTSPKPDGQYLEVKSTRKKKRQKSPTPETAENSANSSEDAVAILAESSEDLQQRPTDYEGESKESIESLGTSTVELPSTVAKGSAGSIESVVSISVAFEGDVVKVGSDLGSPKEVKEPEEESGQPMLPVEALPTGPTVLLETTLPKETGQTRRMSVNVVAMEESPTVDETIEMSDETPQEAEVQKETKLRFNLDSQQNMVEAPFTLSADSFTESSQQPDVAEHGNDESSDVIQKPDILKSHKPEDGNLMIQMKDSNSIEMITEKSEIQKVNEQGLTMNTADISVNPMTVYSASEVNAPKASISEISKPENGNSHLPEQEPSTGNIGYEASSPEASVLKLSNSEDVQPKISRKKSNAGDIKETMSSEKDLTNYTDDINLNPTTVYSGSEVNAPKASMSEMSKQEEDNSHLPEQAPSTGNIGYEASSPGTSVLKLSNSEDVQDKILRQKSNASHINENMSSETQEIDEKHLTKSTEDISLNPMRVYSGSEVNAAKASISETSKQEDGNSHLPEQEPSTGNIGYEASSTEESLLKVSNSEDVQLEILRQKSDTSGIKQNMSSEVQEIGGNALTESMEAANVTSLTDNNEPEASSPKQSIVNVSISDDVEPERLRKESDGREIKEKTSYEMQEIDKKVLTKYIEAIIVKSMSMEHGHTPSDPEPSDLKVSRSETVSSKVRRDNLNVVDIQNKKRVETRDIDKTILKQYIEDIIVKAMMVEYGPAESVPEVIEMQKMKTSPLPETPVVNQCDPLDESKDFAECLNLQGPFDQRCLVEASETSIESAPKVRMSVDQADKAEVKNFVDAISKGSTEETIPRCEKSSLSALVGNKPCGNARVETNYKVSTKEIVKKCEKRCPDVITENKPCGATGAESSCTTLTKTVVNKCEKRCPDVLKENKPCGTTGAESSCTTLKKDIARKCEKKCPDVPKENKACDNPGAENHHSNSYQEPFYTLTWKPREQNQIPSCNTRCLTFTATSSTMLESTTSTEDCRDRLLLFTIDLMKDNHQQLNWEKITEMIKKIAVKSFIGVIAECNTPLNSKVLTVPVDYVLTSCGMHLYKKSSHINQTMREYLGKHLIQALVSYILCYIGWLKLPVRRGKFIDIYDTHMTICMVGNGGTSKDYEQFMYADKRADIRLKFLQALAEQFKAADLTFSLSGELEIRISPIGWDQGLVGTRIQQEDFNDVVIFGPNKMPMVEQIFKSQKSGSSVKYVKTDKISGLETTLEIVMSVQ